MTSATDELLTEYAIDHIDWPDSADGLDRFLEGKSMTSAIDELLEDLREREATIYRDAAYPGRGPVCGFAKASQIARHIAAVEELVMFKANHTGGLVGVEDVQDGGTVTLAPTVGLQPMAILDPPEPLRRNRTRPIEEANHGDQNDH